MLTTAPPPEMAVEKPQVRLPNESKAGPDGRHLRAQLAGNNGSAEPASSARRGKRRRNTRGVESPSPVQRFFLTRNGNNAIPELEQEVEDENTAMVEALKTGGTYIMLSEWRPTVDNTTKGRPLFTKEAVSFSKTK
jgi:hypothetical protein